MTLKLDRSEATLVDTIRMVVRVSGSRKSESQPVLKGTDAFQITPGGTSSRLEMINGKVKSGIEFTYFLRPKKSGTFHIGPVEVTVKGKTFQSNAEKLVVVTPQKATGRDRESLFLVAELSSKEVFLEEQAIFILKLYRRVNVRNISLNMPDMEHVKFTQLGKPREYQSVYDGLTYQVLEVKYAMAASMAGEYPIGPVRMDMTMLQTGRRSPGGLFDDPFFTFSQGRPVSVAAGPLALKVRPLPQKGRPPEFSGLVGRFRMTSELNPDHLKTGESATLTVIVDGHGNVNLIPDLSIPDLDHIKVYADQPVLKTTQGPEGLRGSKTMKWALVPDKDGRLIVPPLVVSYFDTAAREYHTMKTDAYTLTVLPGEAPETQAAVAAEERQKNETSDKQSVKEIGRDILPIHSAIRDFTASSHQFGGWVFFLIFIAPVIVYMGLHCALKFRGASPEALSRGRSKKAARVFMRRSRSRELASDEMILAARDYLNDRFGLSIGVLTPHEAEALLKARGVRPETAEQMKGILKGLEDAIYTGKREADCRLGEGLQAIIRKIEKELR
ncbi:MAG: protein BatD [Deltaproteobacteria bacterium]|nr:protein BatD [Deltaproteobacteria bacterium]